MKQPRCFGQKAAKSQIIIGNCECLVRIIHAWKHYQSLRKHMDDEATQCIALGMYFDEDYKHEQFLNDYNHIISTHSNHLEDIYQQLDKCVLSECSMTRRDILNISANESKDNNENDETNDTNPKLSFLMDLLNTIHYWLYHQFDIGMRVNGNVLNNECNDPFDEYKHRDGYFDKKLARIRQCIKQRRISSNFNGNRSRQTEKYALKIDKMKNFHSVDDEETFIDAFFAQLNDEGIPTTALNALKHLVESEEYDSECIIPDIVDYENGSNMVNHTNDRQFTQFIQEYSSELKGMYPCKNILFPEFTYLANTTQHSMLF